MPSLLASPIISSAMEAVAVNVIMPLNNFGIFKYLLRTPVIIPHIAPDKTAAIVAIKGLTPIEMSVPQIAAPIKKLPSAVRSAKSSKRYVRKIPSANKQHGRPLDKIFKIISKKAIIR